MYNPRKTGNNNTKQKIRNTYPPLRSEKPPKLPTPFRGLFISYPSVLLQKHRHNLIGLQHNINAVA